MDRESPATARLPEAVRPFDFRDGQVARSTGPGLGIEVDDVAEAAVRGKAVVGHVWRSPSRRHDDGSFTEW